VKSPTVTPKKIPDINNCNLEEDDQILIIIGTNTPDTTGHQMSTQVRTSPDVCFCTTRVKQNKRNTQWNQQHTFVKNWTCPTTNYVVTHCHIFGMLYNRVRQKERMKDRQTDRNRETHRQTDYQNDVVGSGFKSTFTTDIDSSWAVRTSYTGCLHTNIMTRVRRLVLLHYLVKYYCDRARIHK